MASIKMMKQCYTDISIEDMNIMRNKAADLHGRVLENGTVTWAEMNAAGIATSDTSIDRMALNHIRHWSELVTHAEAKKRYDDEQFARSAQGINLAKAQKLLFKKTEEDDKKTTGRTAKKFERACRTTRESTFRYSNTRAAES